MHKMYFCNIPSVLIIMASITDYCVILLWLNKAKRMRHRDNSSF